MKLNPEGWEEPKRILAVLAHPDDPEFFCGASLARWAQAGHQITYCLLTRGDKGTNDRSLDPYTLMQIREKEENAAAAVLGVKTVRFLDHPDGYLVPDLSIRKEVVRVIRQERPDILVTSDPTNYFPSDVYINHPDHRAAGQIALEAVFPAAGNHLFFPELLHDEGLETHSVKEVWITLTHQPNLILDVSDTWEMKISALHQHVSQIGDVRQLDEKMHKQKTADSPSTAPRYEEGFRRLILS